MPHTPYSPLTWFFADFLSAAACGDLCRSVGRNWMVSFLPRQLTCHHTQQLIGGKFTNFRQLLVITCELPRQETDHSVTTHAPTQVTTGRHWSRGKLTNFGQRLVITCELPSQGTDHSVTTHAPTQVTQAATDRENLTNFRQLLVMTCELPRQETDHSVTTHAPTQVTTGSSW